LKGIAGDAINAIFSAAAMNFQKLLRAFGPCFRGCLLGICSQFQLFLALVDAPMQKQTI